jgi:hypothetical protein
MRYHNPDFQPPPDGLRAEFARMRASPTAAPRPLITLSGWRAVAIPAQVLASRLRKLIGSVETLSLCFTTINRFERAAEHVVRCINRRYPSGDPDQTVEVDVVATSMAGLVCRLAATQNSSRARLRIGRLFTLATPHRGAVIAGRIAPDPTVRDMRPGSAFLSRLDAALPLAEYELVCYARLRDAWVDARNTAPPGREPFWVPGTMLWSHHTITADQLIVADIARRIRGEEPLARRASPPPRG